MSGGPPGWLQDAVVYQVFLPSFADSDGDGTGDLPGALQRLDHLAWLGVDTVWFNPCFVSPFRDAGYDVADYLTIAPRYGTNDDMVAFVDAAAERGIRVLLDLVAGHTSVEHPWFQASADDPSDDRYVWSDRSGPGRVRSPGSRPGWYLKNFYDEQPALNFGYARSHPDEPWRQPVDAPGPRANRAALQQVMAFWLDRGVAGFRVDMPYSLVKDDPGLVETARLWRELRDWLADRAPEAVLLPENDPRASPATAVQAGFDADFFLVIDRPHSMLFNNGGAGTLAVLPDHRHCYFHADPADPAGTLGAFLQLWQEHLDGAGRDRLVVLPSADHDYSRLATAPRTGEQLGAAFTFLLTWPAIPSIYYGDEIGMRYLPDLPDHEGSRWSPGFNRAGCRTPMQWDDDEPNAGFSTAPPDRLYLPQDPDPARPTVAAQRRDPGSTLNLVRRLLRLRRSTPALRPGASLEVLSAGYPLVHLRGGTHLVVVNPSGRSVSTSVPALRGSTATRVEGQGVDVEDGEVRVEPFGHAVLALTPTPR